MAGKNLQNNFLNIFVLIGLFSLVGCGHHHPVAFQAGDFQCEFCKMGIVDMRYKSEVISPKGKIFRFDSIECLLRWKQRHPQEVASAWVSDFFHPEQWLLLEKAYYLKSEKLSSPMGAFLSAYASPKDLQTAQKQFGGNAITFQSLVEALPSK